MVRSSIAVFTMLAMFGCAPPPPAQLPVEVGLAPEKPVTNDVPVVPKAAPTDPKSLLTPEPSAGIKPTPRDATKPSPRVKDNRSLDLSPTAPKAIPDVPMRKPVQVVGDLRFYSRGGIGGLAASPDGKWLACSGNGVRLFDPATGKEVATFHGNDGGGFRMGGFRMVFSPDSARSTRIAGSAASSW